MSLLGWISLSCVNLRMASRVEPIVNSATDCIVIVVKIALVSPAAGCENTASKEAILNTKTEEIQAKNPTILPGLVRPLESLKISTHYHLCMSGFILINSTGVERKV